jgi:hypothetical protein
LLVAAAGGREVREGLIAFKPVGVYEAGVIILGPGGVVEV